MSNKIAEAMIDKHLAIPTGKVRLNLLRSGLHAEIKYGLRPSLKVPKCSTIVRTEFGLTGKKESLLAQFDNLLTSKGVFTDDV